MKTTSDRPLSKIGIGSFGIGGRGHRDVELTEKADDQVYINAVAYALDQGSNFTEISLGYGHSNAINLFKQGLDKSSLKREDIFLTHALYPRDLPTFETIQEDTNSFHRIMESEYTDSTLVTQSLILKFGESEIYSYLDVLLKSGQTRYVSLSNASPTWIKKFKSKYGNKFFAHEGHLSFEVRALQDKGVFDLCEELGVENIVWRPLGRSQSLHRNWPLLAELSEKYAKTQSQIILNWICNLGYRPMVFSTNKQHIDQNLSATDFQMELGDYRKMNEFRPPHYRHPKIEWGGKNIDDDIVSLVRDFDSHIIT